MKTYEWNDVIKWNHLFNLPRAAKVDLMVWVKILESFEGLRYTAFSGFHEHIVISRKCKVFILISV